MSATNKRKSENLTEKGKILTEEGPNNGKKLKQNFSGDSVCKNEMKDCQEDICQKDCKSSNQNIMQIQKETEEKIKRITEPLLQQLSDEHENPLSLNKDVKPYMKQTMRKIVDEQRLALKFIQMALQKFQRVTDDLQELLESEIEEQIGYLPPVAHLMECEQLVNNQNRPSSSRKQLKKSKVNHPFKSKSCSKSSSKNTLVEDRLQTESDSDDEQPEGGVDYLNTYPSENSNTNSGFESESLRRIQETDVASCSVDLLQSLRGISEHSVLTPDTNYDFEAEETFSVPTNSAPNRRDQGISTSIGGNSRKRPCPYCGVLQAKLSRHLQLKHKHEPLVARAINSPRDERVKLFCELRKLGIKQASERILEEERIQADERISDDGGGSLSQADFVMCSSCNGYYKKSKYKKHSLKCLENRPEKDWEYYSPDVVLQEL